jgi:hypothetical protein
LLYEQTLRLLIPGDDDTTLALISQLHDRPVLVAIGLSSQVTHLMGTPENAARLLRSVQLSSKTTGSQWEFTCQATAPMGWLID